MDPDILLIGEALIDVVCRPGQAPQRIPGGSPLNVAVGLGRLGHAPMLATWLGSDADGQAIRAQCASSGVSILPGCDHAMYTSTAEATIDAAGHASYVFFLDCQMPPIRLETPPGVIHTGSLGALVDPGAEVVLDYVEAHRHHSFITFDPNVRPMIMDPPKRLLERVGRYVAASDVVKVSDEDLAWLYPGTKSRRHLIARAREWLAMGPDVVVVTRGAQGALVATASGDLTVPADTTRALRDTIGAGDSFMAGLIHGLVTHGYATGGRRPSENWTDLRSILAQASIIAGITVSRVGADPPWLAELSPYASNS
ncbi:MAG: carbohydrate kinase [Propionibacteriaceae bacterium]|nr:carbohydrate kinase [Propionibacteriaceae bacterium]